MDLITFIIFDHSSFWSQLHRDQDNSPLLWGWFVLVGPRGRKPSQCIPCLLRYDVIQWRMDHVLHHWWIRETQKWSDVQPWFPLWSRRVQNKLQQYFCKLNIPQIKMTLSTKRPQLKSSFLFTAKFINCTLIVPDIMLPKVASDLMWHLLKLSLTGWWYLPRCNLRGSPGLVG